MNISQTTVELAYGQLHAEGYITSKPRVGFYVEAIDEIPFTEKVSSIQVSQKNTVNIKYDFSPAKIDEDTFPFLVWRKIAKELLDESNSSLLQSGHPQGEIELRIQIARYLYESRGIICDAEQIVVGSGTEQLLPMILRLFDNTPRLALENPGYSPIPRVHLQNQAIPIDVDEEGIQVEQLEQTDAKLVYITPSHQFPTGAILSAARRTHLLSWAMADQDRYIIEDDYDSEFRYIGKPIPALQSIDKAERVIYMSTFSKSFMPSLRVAYFILPYSLIAKYKAIFSHYACTVPRFDQQMLAEFMLQGHFSKHLNRMRKIYRKKHDKILSIFEKHYPEVTISGDMAGMHMLISFTHPLDEQSIKAHLFKQHIRIQPLNQYTIDKKESTTPSFILGFGGIPYDEIDQAIHQLMKAIYETT